MLVPVRRLRNALLGGLSLLGQIAAVQSIQAADLSGIYHWKPLKIGAGGFVTGIAFHPTTPNLIYIRTDVGGIYRWNAAQQRWNQLLLSRRVPKERPADYNVESLALSAQNDRVIYIAVGDTLDKRMGRILKSTDQGRSWTDNGQRWRISGNDLNFRTGGERLAVDPNNDAIAYFGSFRQGLWVTRNAGATWSQVPAATLPLGTKTAKPAGIPVVAFDPTSSILNDKTQRLYAGVAGKGLYRSSDAGASWQKVCAVRTNQTPYTVQIGSNGIAYFSLAAAADGETGAVKSYDPSTNTCRDMTPNRPAYRSLYFVAVDPFNPQRLFVAPDGVSDGNLWRSLDGGQTWTALNVALNAANDVPWIVNTDEENYLSAAALRFNPLVPNQLWFPQGMGVWRTQDLGDGEVTWNFASKGIEELVTTDIIAPPGGKPVSAAYDRQGFYHVQPNVFPKRPLVDPILFGGTSLDYSGNQPQFLVTVQAKNNIPWADGRGAYSVDGGKNWTLFAGKPPDNQGGNVAVSATNPDHIVWVPSSAYFFNGKPPYFSRDRGATWQKSAGYTGNATIWQYWLAGKKVLDADKVEGDVFYLVTFDDAGRFYVSTDGGATFVQAAYAPRCAYNDACHVRGQARAVPGYARHVWSTGYLGGLYFTTDAGATPWTKIANVQTAIALGFGAPVSPSTYPTVFVTGTVNNQQGLWRSTDQGQTWDKVARYPGGLYNKITTVNGDMNRPGRVYVGLSGNGFLYGDPQ